MNLTRLGLSLSLVCLSLTVCFAQRQHPHKQAHAHNDYEHTHPLKDALQNGFISVEADVYLRHGNLLVSHHRPKKKASNIERLYFAPLDSMAKANGGHIYPGSDAVFYLMIDCKSEAKSTLQAIRQLATRYPALVCLKGNCPVQIFLSGNRPVDRMVAEGYTGIAIDGRPGDLGKGYPTEIMPVISDHFRNWSAWDGKSNPSVEDLRRVKELVRRVHAERKKLRLWSIPDNELTWGVLVDAGVDLINTDRLPDLNRFLTEKGL